MDIVVRGFIQLFVSGGMKFSGGRSSGRRPRVEARSAERGGIWGGGVPSPGVPSPGMGSGVSSPGKFWNLRRNFVQLRILARNWRFSSFPPLWTKTLP